jgi:hypothetical protein
LSFSRKTSNEGVGGADFAGTPFTAGVAILDVPYIWGQNPGATDEINGPDFNIGVESGT